MSASQLDYPAPTPKVWRTANLAAIGIAARIVAVDWREKHGSTLHSVSCRTARYDAWNRMTEVDLSGSAIEKMEYDGTSRRIQTFSNFSGTGTSATATVLDDYYLGQQVIESHKTTAYNLTTKIGTAAGGYQNIWSPRYIDSLILRDTLATDRSSIVLAERILYLGDANYNVTGLLKQVSGTWTVVERYTYTPYGVVTYRDSTWTAYTGTNPQSLFSNTALYTGRVWDALIQLYYYRARWYDATMERFISTDPIGADLNLYRYCSARPTDTTDPSGLWTKLLRHSDQNWTSTCARAGDTWQSLAKLAHMDPQEYQSWVKEGPNLPAKPIAGKTYHVPNTVYVCVGYSIAISSAAPQWIWWAAYLTNPLLTMAPNPAFYAKAGESQWSYKVQGYHVVYDSKATKPAMQGYFANRDIYGFEFWGHGEGGALIAADFPDGDVFSPYYLDRQDVHAAHKVAFLRLHACEAGLGKYSWSTLVVSGGDCYAPKGEVYPLYEMVGDGAMAGAAGTQ